MLEPKNRIPHTDLKTQSLSSLLLGTVTGNLLISGTPNTDTFDVYFHVPIAYQEQVPIYFIIEHEQLIDYRFIRLTPPNILGVARMKSAPGIKLNWKAYVIIKENRYEDLPTYAPLVSEDQLPDSVKEWLLPSDCVQSNHSFIIEKAEEVKDTATCVIRIADQIIDAMFYQGLVPGGFGYMPYSLDAYYALNWGGSCTSRAHAAVALMRAMGIPARSFFNAVFDLPRFEMHWKAEYYVPEYGWIRLGTTWGDNPYDPQESPVLFIVRHENEFPLIINFGIEYCSHTSNPELGWSPDFVPGWGGGHYSRTVTTILDSIDVIDRVHVLADSIFEFYTQYWGIHHTSTDQALLDQAFDYQSDALNDLENQDLQSTVFHMEQALNVYRGMNPEAITILYENDFEQDVNGWTHGGDGDNWEWGIPASGPTQTHSGDKCWGTNLDGSYQSLAKSWLLSPPIDLRDLSCAYLSVWIWNWLQEGEWGENIDFLWMDITQDGSTFTPLCSRLCGVNDNPVIPVIGGWNRLVLNLHRYIGSTVQIRFLLYSDATEVQLGSYIDDFTVYGRPMSTTAVYETNKTVTAFDLSDNFPNPFNNQTLISFQIPRETQVRLEIYDVLGQKIRTLVNERKVKGSYTVSWDGKNDRNQIVSSGIYLYSLQVNDQIKTRKMMLLR
jgi:hypothetical protein